MDTIFSTRRGFLYQDLVGLLTFLQHYQAKDVQAFYIDYPTGTNQKSLDLRLLNPVGTERITEVKTGENFKMDRRRRESSEIRDALISIDEYLAVSLQASARIVVRPYLKNKIAEIWVKLKAIKDSPTFASPLGRAAAIELATQFQIPGKTDGQSFYLLAKRVEVEEYSSDELQNDGDGFCPIEDDILDILRDLATKFHASAADFELPIEQLMFQMLHLCVQKAGTREDLVECLEEALIQFFGRRRMVAKYDGIRDRDQELEQCVNKVKEDVIAWRTGETSTAPDTSITEPTGGQL